jgi:predicted deacylase
MACALPAAARADVASDATALRKSLNLGTLSGMPSGRTAYRTAGDFNAEMDALAAADPGLVAVKTAPYPSTEGRAVEYLEITNNVGAADGKPVFFLMGAIHGNESAAGEDDLEFAYDVVHQAATNPAVQALLDHVRLVDMPLVNPDGWTHNTRAGATNTDLNRNYPFGWGSNIGVVPTQRGSGPGSEPEVRNTMAIVQSHQVVDLVTTHTNERAIFYPELDVPAGDTPELNTGYRALAVSLGDATANGYTNIRDSAHDYPTSGETIDWAYYAARTLALTVELVGSVRGCPQSHPDYLNCTTADFTGTPGPTSTATQTSVFAGHAARDAFWQALAWASLPAGHSVITGTAVPGATLKISKAFDLYTAPISNGATPPVLSPPQAIPTHLESSLVVPASGRFSWAVDPSVRATPAFRADGEVGGPNGFLDESWTITCTAPDGTRLDTEHVTVDRGQVDTVSLCTQGGVGGTVPATLALSLTGPASFGTFTPGVAHDYTATTTADVLSTAGDAALRWSDPDTANPGHLVNRAFSLPQALLASANGGAFAPVSSTLLTYSGPVSHDSVALTFKQPIGAGDPLRTGSYSKTLVFTLSTTTP